MAKLEGSALAAFDSGLLAESYYEEYRYRNIHICNKFVENADFHDSVFDGCMFDNVSFKDCNFRDCYFSNCIFDGCNFYELDFSNTAFSYCLLTSISPYDCIFDGVSFDYCAVMISDEFKPNFDKLKLVDYTLGIYQTCPEKGSYIGFKKVRHPNGGRALIVELEIPATAGRSSASGRKCRASCARVISITDLEGNTHDEYGNRYEVAVSMYDELLEYRLGEIVTPNSWDDNRWNECSNGIHHYLTMLEAVRH